MSVEEGGASSSIGKLTDDDYDDKIQIPHRAIQASSAPSVVSAKTSRSIEPPHNFRKTDSGPEMTRDHGESSQVVLSQFDLTQEMDLPLIFQSLDQNIVAFVRSELKRYWRILSDCEQTMPPSNHNANASEGFLKVTLHFLRQMNQTKFADLLEKRHLGELAVCQNKLKSNTKMRFENVFEGLAKQGNPTQLNKIYTEVYIVEGESGAVNTEHEVRQIEAASRKMASQERSIRCEDIFEPLLDHSTRIRTVLTKGVAGIGKTLSSQKFALDWAEGKTNPHIQLLFSLPFRELNLMKGRIMTLTDFMSHLFVESTGILDVAPFRVLFIFDGLDEYRLPLDFKNNEALCDATKSSTVDVLLTNLITGNLLPSAQVWITSRPAASTRIPADCVDRVTEIRGFNDPQKEEYIRKRISDKTLANQIISHVRSSRSLFIMCHIPVFSWILTTVLERLLSQSESREIPKTLTQMYAHFLSFNILMKQQKYSGRVDKGDSLASQINRDKEMILKLGMLAYEQLEYGNLIFYEHDLRDCGINMEEASVYSGVFTQIFKEEFGLFQDKVFCFVHLTIQEFLAALYVLHTFNHTNVNVMVSREDKNQTLEDTTVQAPFTSLHIEAVDKSLESKNGHLDLFLRFLMGLSLESSKTLVQGLLGQRGNLLTHAKEDIILYIKEKIRQSSSPERCINLFHCLNELNDHSLVEEIQSFLNSGHLQESLLSPAQWSALVFVLLTSEEDLEVFELKKYSRSDEGLRRLIPVIKASRTARLSSCNLTERSCEALALVLSSTESQLREMDLSDNDLQDSGIKKLASGLANSNCKLELLRLSFCGITEEGCSSLATALQSNPSSLRELDLTYNHPDINGVKLLSALLESSFYRLKKLSLDYAGECWLKSGLRKYACELTLDQNTACRQLVLSDGNQKMTQVKELQPYPDHPERFSNWGQVLCREALTGRCYWEVEWSGKCAGLGVAYKGICRKGEGNDYVLGYNAQSWSIRVFDDSYNAWHNKKGEPISSPSPISKRVGVYLDWSAGTLSFYSVGSNTLSHLHTFQTTFREPLYPGFRLWHDDVSLYLCKVE